MTNRATGAEIIIGTMVCSKTTKLVLFSEIFILNEFKYIYFSYLKEFCNILLIFCILNKFKLEYLRI